MVSSPISKSKEAYYIILMFLNYIDKSAGINKKGFGSEYLHKLSFKTLKHIYRLYGKVNKKGKLEIECPYSRYIKYEDRSNVSETINKRFVINYLATSVYISDTKFITNNCQLHPDDSNLLNQYSIPLNMIGQHMKKNKSFRDAFLSHILETTYLDTNKLTNEDMNDIATLQRRLYSTSPVKNTGSAKTSSKTTTASSKHSAPSNAYTLSKQDIEYLDYLKSCPNDKNKIYFKVDNDYYMFIVSYVKDIGLIMIYNPKQKYGWLDILDKCVKRITVDLKPSSRLLIQTAINKYQLPILHYDGKNAVFYNGRFEIPKRPKENTMNFLKSDLNLKYAIDIYKHSTYIQ